MRSGNVPRERTLDGGEDLRGIDAEVATHLMGYRWVEWNHPRLGGAPIDEPGAFLVARHDVLNHLYMPADSNTSPRCDPYARVPRYSAELDHAFAAAEAAGLFTDGDAAISRRAGAWLLEIRANGHRFDGRELPVVICHAALAWSRYSRNAPKA